MDVRKQWSVGIYAEKRDVRIEKFFFIPAVSCADAFGDDFFEFLTEDVDCFENGIVNSGEWGKRLNKVVHGEFCGEPFEDLGRMEQSEALAEFFCPSFTYQVTWPTMLVKLASPVRSYYDEKGSGYSYSWGFYQTVWIAGNSVREITRHAIKWHKEQVANWKQESDRRRQAKEQSNDR